MKIQEFSKRRSKETTKPKVTCPDIKFYYCNNCGSIFQDLSLIKGSIPICCNEIMDKLEEKDLSEVSNEISIDYKIVGGYNENAVEIFWKIKKEDILVKWIYLRTFTGWQIKYVVKQKKASFTFALADEDAYVYCDKNPCLECTFLCKRGFEIYVHINKNIVIKIPLERMHFNQQSSV